MKKRWTKRKEEREERMKGGKGKKKLNIVS